MQHMSKDKINNQTEKPILSIREASLLMDVSIAWLYKMTSQKKIPYYKPNGKMIYFDRSELIAYVTRNRVAADYELKPKAIEMLQKGVLK